MDKNESESPISCLILSKIVAKRGWAHPFGVSVTVRVQTS